MNFQARTMIAALETPSARRTMGNEDIESVRTGLKLENGPQGCSIFMEISLREQKAAKVNHGRGLTWPIA